MLDRIHHRRAPHDYVDLLIVAAAGPSLGLALLRCALQRFGSLEQRHSTLARDVLELPDGPLIDRVKEFAGEYCSRLCLDTSRNAIHRWCGMRQCSARVKSASY